MSRWVCVAENKTVLDVLEQRLDVLEALVSGDVRCVCFHPVHREGSVGLRVQDLLVARCFRRGRVCKWLCYEEVET